MTGECNGLALVFSLVFVGMGAFEIILGVAAWVRAESRFVQRWLVECYPSRDRADPVSRFLGLTRERSGPAALWVTRFLGPFNGTVFVIVGIYLTSYELQCGLRSVPIPPLIGPLAFRFWPPMIPFIAFAAVIGVLNSWRASLPQRVHAVLTTVLTAFCWAEAAAFHIGIEAQRWFAASVGVLVLSGIVAHLMRRSRNVTAGS